MNMKGGLLLFIGFILFNTGAAFSQTNYDWKEMAVVGVYNYRTETFWNNYQNQKDTIKANILRAKKLGFNMARIDLNYIPPNDRPADDPNPPSYKHGWPDSNYVGTGKVFQGIGSQDWSSAQYLSDIDDLINFCTSNAIKVHVVLFNYAGNGKRDNWAGDYDAQKYKYTSYYATPDSNLYQRDRVKWFVDACSWIDTILSRTINKIEVCELFNEAYPETELLNPPPDYYPPTFFMDQFLLEMPNYLHYRWPSIKLMASIQPRDQTRWANLKAMLRGVENKIFTRPDSMSMYIDSLYAHGKITSAVHDSIKNDKHFQKCYFDYLSAHNYSTYSFKVVLDKYVFGSPSPTVYQTKHTYSWFVGEMGFDIGTPQTYEIDQTKCFQTAFQVLGQEYNYLSSHSNYLKGFGIWSTFDYNGAYYGAPYVEHIGIISPDNQSLAKKRKAAYLVRNELEGYVDNPVFGIGPGSDTLFNDAPYCNGWTAWFPTCCQSFISTDYTYPTGGGYLQLNPAPTRRIGWSSIPGGLIRVYPGDSIKISDSVWTDTIPRAGAKIYLQLAWQDQNGVWINFPSPPYDSTNQVTSAGWHLLAKSFKVPSNAYYTAPYLHAWWSNATTRFYPISYRPGSRPLISFTFDDDISYFPATDNDNGTMAIGWTKTQGAVQRQNGELDLNQGYTIVNSSHYPGVQSTLIRTRPNYYYSAVAYMNSQSSNFKAVTLSADTNDYPDTVFQHKTTSVSGSSWGIYKTPWIQCGSTEPWYQVQFEDGGYGNTKVKEVAVFEAVSIPIGINIPVLPKNERANLKFELLGNYPNPFNPSTKIRYSLAEASIVSLRIFDVLGREVATLVNQYENAGFQSVEFNARNLPSGVYFYRLQAGSFTGVKKMLLMK